MLDLKQGECRGWNMKVAEQRFFFQGFKQVRNIVCIAYAVVWSSKPEQGSKCNIPYLKVPLEAFFFRHFSSKQKSFHLLARELRDECSASISVEIISFERLQQGSYEKLNPGIFLQKYVQANVSQVATMMAVWKIITMFRSSNWNFSSPHYVRYFVPQRLQKFTFCFAK